MMGDIFFLFPRTSSRLLAYHDILQGVQRAERYLLYGLDYFLKKGVPCKHNLQGGIQSTSHSILNRLHRSFFCRFFGYGGRLDWLLPAWRDLRKAKCCVALTGHVAFPLIQYQSLGLLPKIPVVYISIGLPERLNDISRSCPSRYEWWIKHLNRLPVIVCLSWPELEMLKEFHGLKNVKFIPAGVDTSYFLPQDVPATVDVLSIGGDRNRDFMTLIQAAKELPEYNFKVITNEYHAQTLVGIPGNVHVSLNVPMRTIRDEIAKCRCVALPVRDNSYSGATTVLLQAMSMGKVVIANSIGANINGYGLQNNKNVVIVSTGSHDQLAQEIRNCLLYSHYSNGLGLAARKMTVEMLGLESFHEKLFSLVSRSIC